MRGQVAVFYMVFMYMVVATTADHFDQLSKLAKVTRSMHLAPHLARDGKEMTPVSIQNREVTPKRRKPVQATTESKKIVEAGNETTPKPTKYHYYPHNQHIYLLPECAIQQVCNAVYVRLNYTQPLCACPSRKEPCSASLNTDDQHTTQLASATTGQMLTLVKTCEPVSEMRVCRAPRDWSLLALQNVRTGKSHYLVICRCPGPAKLEGPMSHEQPTYASVPGIRVYGMMCIHPNYKLSSAKRPARSARYSSERRPALPWEKLRQFKKENMAW